MSQNIKIVLWCSSAPNQVALATKVHKEFGLSALVVEKKRRAKRSLPKILSRVLDKIFFRSIDLGWISLMNYYQKSYPEFPSVALLNTENINSEEVYEFTHQQQPDIIMVSGTSMVKERLLSLKPGIGIINLHTGLSPYVKGGPNCTNWCISNGEFYLIGNTIMWINAGIDTGNIITTDFVQLTGEENFNVLHQKVMDQAHDLYLKALKRLVEDPKTCPNVPQDTIIKGKLYYTRMWDWKAKRRLKMNFSKLRAYVQSGAMERDRTAVKVIKL